MRRVLNSFAEPGIIAKSSNSVKFMCRRAFCLMSSSSSNFWWKDWVSSWNWGQRSQNSMLSVVLVLKGSEVRYPIHCVIISSEKSIQFFRVLQFSFFAQIFSMLFVDAMLDRNSLSLFLINLFLDTSKFVTAFVSIITNVEWVDQRE